MMATVRTMSLIPMTTTADTSDAFPQKFFKGFRKWLGGIDNEFDLIHAYFSDY